MQKLYWACMMICWRCCTDILDVPCSDCTISWRTADCGTVVPEVRKLSWIPLQVYQAYHPAWWTTCQAEKLDKSTGRRFQRAREREREYETAYLCDLWGFCRCNLRLYLLSSSSLSGNVAKNISSMSDSPVHSPTQQGYRNSSAADTSSWQEHRVRSIVSYRSYLLCHVPSKHGLTRHQNAVAGTDKNKTSYITQRNKWL